MDELERIRIKKIEELKKRMGVSKMETEIEVNDINFKKEVIEKSKDVPVVVDFWAEWCAPCRMLGPVLEKLAKEYGGKFILAKANVDKAREKATEYGISSIPAVKLFKGGKVVEEFVGALPEKQIKAWLDRNLEGK
jgi:putative thioredoxin